jgi:uncharacterized membrane protein
MTYFILKALHVAAVVVFLGNITVGVFWKLLADRTKNAQIIAYTLGGIIAADRVFTIPGVIVLLGAGIATALVGNIPLLRTGWLFWGILLFVISGLAFGPFSRVQKQLHELAAQGLSTAEEQRRYEGLSNSWNILGTIALAAPVVALFIMVIKPALPAIVH